MLAFGVRLSAWGYGWSFVSPVLHQTKHVVEMMFLFCQRCCHSDVLGHELQQQMQGVAQRCD
jgi:hypothetical protein